MVLLQLVSGPFTLESVSHQWKPDRYRPPGFMSIHRDVTSCGSLVTRLHTKQTNKQKIFQLKVKHGKKCLSYSVFLSYFPVLISKHSYIKSLLQYVRSTITFFYFLLRLDILNLCLKQEKIPANRARKINLIQRENKYFWQVFFSCFKHKLKINVSWFKFFCFVFICNGKQDKTTE